MESAFKVVYNMYQQGRIGDKDWGTLLAMFWMELNNREVGRADEYLSKWVTEVRKDYPGSRR